MSQHLRFTKGIDKSCTTSPRSTLGSTLRMTRSEKGMRSEFIDIPTTITVNWTPFLTLFPLRLPANDIFCVENNCEGV